MSNTLFYITDRDRAQELSPNPKIAIECDYHEDSDEELYQMDVWFFGINPTTQELHHDHIFYGGVFSNPVLLLRFGKRIIEYIEQNYPNAEIVIIDSISEQGIRNSLDIQAKHDVKQLARLKP